MRVGSMTASMTVGGPPPHSGSSCHSSGKRILSRVSDFLCMRQTGSGGGMFCLEVERDCGGMCSFGRGISSSDELGLGGGHVVSVMPAEVSAK